MTSNGVPFFFLRFPVGFSSNPGWFERERGDGTRRDETGTGEMDGNLLIKVCCIRQ